jgi:hypothetical protein
VAVYDSNNVYVAFEIDPNGVVVKYDVNGSELWSRECVRGSIGEIHIELDSEGNIYVAHGSNDYVTTRYDPNGNKLWTAKYDGPANDLDYVGSLALDEACNVYVTGASYRFSCPDDFVTIKYGPDANQPVWIGRYEGQLGTWNEPLVVAVDSSGNVYVTGENNSDYITIKYSNCYQVGDTDCDSDVDLMDFSQVAECWLDSDCEERDFSDLDGDGEINLNDILKLSSNWLKGT